MGDRTRTGDSHIHNLTASDHNTNQYKQVTMETEAKCTIGRTRDEREGGGILDADLAEVMDAWPTLSEPIRAAIPAMMEAAGGGL